MWNILHSVPSRKLLGENKHNYLHIDSLRALHMTWMRCTNVTEVLTNFINNL